MLIEIPDDLARKAKRIIDPDSTGLSWRGLAEDAERTNAPFLAVNYLVLAALADLPEPIQVGHLAKWGDSREVLVVAFDGDLAWVRCANDFRYTVSIKELTYAGPKPEGWGEQ